jgi:hypothetical protein
MIVTHITSTTHAPKTNIPLSSRPDAPDFVNLQNAPGTGDVPAAL